MKKFLVIFILIAQNLCAANIDINDADLKKQIGHMLLIGFDAEQVDNNSDIIKQINTYELGGVVLYDRFYSDKTRVKNIRSPQQLQELTSRLKSLSKQPLLIAVDQEGGKIVRLKPAYGFDEFPSANSLSSQSISEAQNTYRDMAEMLSKNGLNCNLAPVVDLAVTPQNEVIVGLERSYGRDADTVVRYADILIQEQKKAGVLSVLKHFPGHGSSLDDSHLGFVDITDTWSTEELLPYKQLIATKAIDMIMTAHVFNEHLDKKYPATLSHNVNTKLLREEMGFDGVVVSDDLQMKAISKYYSLAETVTLAINSGVDILLFANQLDVQDTDELIETILQQVKQGAIPLQRIEESNRRIRALQMKQ
jgi:beta-N-acetylhexosaminidase